jgi:hypothetical protein
MVPAPGHYSSPGEAFRTMLERLLAIPYRTLRDNPSRPTPAAESESTEVTETEAPQFEPETAVPQFEKDSEETSHPS